MLESKNEFWLGDKETEVHFSIDSFEDGTYDICIGRGCFGCCIAKGTLLEIFDKLYQELWLPKLEKWKPENFRGME